MGLDERWLLFIEPLQPASPVPVIDGITRKMCAAFRRARQTGGAFGGVHSCYCGALSSCINYRLPSRDITNSLCIHYLAHHRVDVDDATLAVVSRFTWGEAKPNSDELRSPGELLLRIRDNVKRRLGPARLAAWSAWGLDLAALTQSLQGGCLPSPAIFTRVRQDAQDLFDLLDSIPLEALPCVQAAALRSHGDPTAWGTDSLCVSGWKRAAWLSPLSDILQLPETVLRDKRLVRMAREKLERDLAEAPED